MSRMARSKGCRGERELVELLCEFGGDAVRTFYQPGEQHKADVDSLFGAFECKMRAKFTAYKWMHEDVRGVRVRANGKPGLIILRERDAARLMQIEREVKGGGGD